MQENKSGCYFQSVDEAFYQHKMLRYFILSPDNMVRKKKTHNKLINLVYNVGDVHTNFQTN